MNKIYRNLDDVVGEISSKDLGYLLNVAIVGIQYWGNIEYDEKDYSLAKLELFKSGVKTPFWEEILGQILLNGSTIRVVDNEYGQESEYTKELTLENLKQGIKLDFLNSDFNYQKANDWRQADAEEGDHIIQWALFDEIIFG